MTNYMRDVLVTGGSGFIGSNICRSLLDEGARVVCVDSLITGSIDSVKPLVSRDGFRFIRQDITEDRFVDIAMERRYDEIYHLACPTGVPNIRKYGEEMLRVCSVGTNNVLQIARHHGSRLVFTSSAEVYGDPEVSPQHETYTGNVDPIGPRSAYEEGKRFSEALLKMYVDKYGVDAKIARVFNAFGVGMSTEDTRVIPGFVEKIRRGHDVTIYGDGTQTRTHMYVDDLVAGLKLIMERGRPGEAYNIGGQDEIRISELFEKIRSLVHGDISARFEPHFIEDHLGRRPLVEKVRDLGWNQQVSVEEGLKRMLRAHGIPLKEDMQERVQKEPVGEHFEEIVAVDFPFVNTGKGEMHLLR